MQTVYALDWLINNITANFRQNFYFYLPVANMLNKFGRLLNWFNKSVVGPTQGEIRPLIGMCNPIFNAFLLFLPNTPRREKN